MKCYHAFHVEIFGKRDKTIGLYSSVLQNGHAKLYLMYLLVWRGRICVPQSCQNTVSALLLESQMQDLGAQELWTRRCSSKDITGFKHVILCHHLKK